MWDDTGLPFVINADFLLVSSREGIREDEAWNKWLRDCIAETYCTSLLDLLNCAQLPLETKISAYASIPRSTHRAFLAPTVRGIQEHLRGQECTIVLPDDGLVDPRQARLCYENFRTVLGLPEHFPSFLQGDVYLVRPELEDYSEQLEAIGVKRISLPEVVSCLEDTAWVENHELSWYVSLFRYLSSQPLGPSDLRGLPIVPIMTEGLGTTRLSCAEELPIYFSRTGADVSALAEVPDWLSELVPIAFVSPAVFEWLDSQPDKDELREWISEKLPRLRFFDPELLHPHKGQDRGIISDH